MRYSLAARFRGTLLGAIAGHFVSTHLWPHPRRVDASEMPAPSPEQHAIQGLLAMLYALAQGDPDLPWDTVARCTLTLPPSERPVGFAVATLPLALFHHHTWDSLLPILDAGVAASQRPAGGGAIAQVLAITFDLALHDELYPLQLPAQILADLSPHHPESAIYTQLNHLQKALDGGWSLPITLSTLPTHPSPGSLPSSLCAALYLVATSPTEPRLLLQRTRIQTLPPFTSTLAGTLAGSLAGAAALQTFLEEQLGGSPGWLAEQWHVSELSEAVALMDQLLARWAGIYQPTSEDKEHLERVAIAPPNLATHRLMAPRYPLAALFNHQPFRKK